VWVLQYQAEIHLYVSIKQEIQSPPTWRPEWEGLLSNEAAAAAAAATLPKFSDKVDSLDCNEQLDTNGLKTGPLPFILHAFSLCG